MGGPVGNKTHSHCEVLEPRGAGGMGEVPIPLECRNARRSPVGWKLLAPVAIAVITTSPATTEASSTRKRNCSTSLSRWAQTGTW